MTTRRSFVEQMISAMSGAAAADAVPQTGPQSGWLQWAIDEFGEDALCGQITDLVRTNSFTFPALRRRMNRKKSKLETARRQRDRRERHAGDVVLYHGPAHLDPLIAQRLVSQGRRCTNNHNKAVLVGTADQGYELITRVACGDVRYAVPAGSRILIDARQGLCDLMACEITQTSGGQCRGHFWRRQQGWTAEPGMLYPRFAVAGEEGGRVYVSQAQRTTGLMGRPLFAG